MAAPRFIPQADFFPHYCCRRVVRPPLIGQRVATLTKRHVWAKSSLTERKGEKF
jgi:hypothetical protein